MEHFSGTFSEPQHSLAQDLLVLYQDYSLKYIVIFILIHFVSLKPS